METEIENQSVISDITELNESVSLSSDEIQQKQEQIRTITETKLAELTIDALKDKCKELGIVGISKFKKPELITALLTKYLKLCALLKDKKANELKNLSKQLNIKGITGLKKDELVWNIIQHCSNNLIFKIDENNVVSPVNSKSKSPIPESEMASSSQKLSLIEELNQQRQVIEQKMKEELNKKQRAEEESQRVKIEGEQKQLEEEKKKEKEESKRRKQAIPKQVRVIVWNHYIGEDIIKHKCLCCKKVTITNTNFDVGHVLSEKNGGTHEINNLRPICGACNHSMGTENMIDFVVKYGLYIG
jgi:5-methylcytosine-specific restriction endonuclease McrA